MGDGSYCARFFRTEEEAEKDAEGDDERPGEDISRDVLEIYADDGTLVMNDKERDDARNSAWTARVKAEVDYDAAKGKKKAELKKALDKADAAWRATLS